MKDLLRLAIEGIDLDARDRARWRIVVLVGLALAIVGLHQAGAWEVVERYDLIGLAVALAASLAGLGQTIKRHSKPPPLPDRVLTREETGRHSTIRQPSVPREATGPHPLQGKLDGSAFEELSENDIDTDRPPPVGPLDDDDHDTDPQTPGAIRRAGR